MSPETLARIFNVFVSTKGARGTGLGLAVSRKILVEHGGDIRATSSEGAGSEFVMEFPARFNATESAAAGSTGHAAS
jgi:signal transduction histidine kinase